jgi:hypothetical protein
MVILNLNKYRMFKLLVYCCHEGNDIILHQNDHEGIVQRLKENPPKLVGGYKKIGWVQKAIDKLDFGPLEVNEDKSYMAQGILKGKNETFYPALFHLDYVSAGKILGIYLMSEKEDSIELIPIEIAQHFLKESINELKPFKYKTIVSIPDDNYQKNWPDFT